MNIEKTIRWIFLNIDYIRNWVTFAADISILLITVYTFKLTFISSKLKILSYGASLGNDGDSYYLVVENRTLKPVVIKNVTMIVDYKWKFLIGSYSKPLIVHPFSTEYIEKEKYAYMEHNDEFKYESIIFEIKTSNKVLYIPFRGKVSKLTKELKTVPYNIQTMTDTYNGKIILPATKYILDVYKDKELVNTIFIYGSGVMSDAINGYNGIPNDYINDKEKVIEILKNLIKDTSYSINIQEAKSFYLKY